MKSNLGVPGVSVCAALGGSKVSQDLGSGPPGALESDTSCLSLHQLLTERLSSAFTAPGVPVPCGWHHCLPYGDQKKQTGTLAPCLSRGKCLIDGALLHQVEGKQRGPNLNCRPKRACGFQGSWEGPGTGLQTSWAGQGGPGAYTWGHTAGPHASFLDPLDGWGD